MGLNNRRISGVSMTICYNWNVGGGVSSKHKRSTQTADRLHAMLRCKSWVWTLNSYPARVLNHKDTKHCVAITWLLQSAAKSNVLSWDGTCPTCRCWEDSWAPESRMGTGPVCCLRQNNALIRHTGGLLLLLYTCFCCSVLSFKSTLADWWGPFLLSTANWNTF